MPEKALRIHAGEPRHVVDNVVVTVLFHRRQHAVGVINHLVIEQLAGQLGLAYQPVPHAAETALGLALPGPGHPSCGRAPGRVSMIPGAAWEILQGMQALPAPAVTMAASTSQTMVWSRVKPLPQVMNAAALIRATTATDAPQATFRKALGLLRRRCLEYIAGHPARHRAGWRWPGVPASYSLRTPHILSGQKTASLALHERFRACSTVVSKGEF